MGFKIGITIADGTEHEDAYFKVRDVAFDLTRKRCEFQLSVYKDKTARDADKAKVKGVPTTTHFIVGGDDFDTYFAESVLATEDKTLIKQCYAYAKAQEDYDSAEDIDPDE